MTTLVETKYWAGTTIERAYISVDGEQIGFAEVRYSGARDAGIFTFPEGEMFDNIMGVFEADWEGFGGSLVDDVERFMMLKWTCLKPITKNKKSVSMKMFNEFEAGFECDFSG